MKILYSFTYFLLIFSFHLAIAQETQETFKVKFEQTPFEECASVLKERYGVLIKFKEFDVKGILISIEGFRSLDEIFGEELLIRSLRLVKYSDKQYFVLPESLLESEFVTKRPVQREKVNFSGKIIDSQTKHPLSGVIRILEMEKQETVSNDGFFEFEVPKGRYSINVRSFNKFETNFDLTLDKPTKGFNIEMFEKVFELEEVTISALSEDQNTKEAIAGKLINSIEEIESLPSFMGETDISRALITLPGVSTVGEGASGFNVRGGNLDQNLILLDGAPVYYSSHLFGFFSLFNPDMVQNFTFYKGGIPPEYGGRNSSVLQVNQKNPDLRDFGLNGSIGPIVSKLNSNIPLKKDKSGVVLGLRTSYPTWILNRVNDTDVANSSASYTDASLKYYHLMSEKTSLTASAYFSRDGFSFSRDTTFRYESGIFNLGLTHEYNENTSIENNVFLSTYSASFLRNEGLVEEDFSNGLFTIGNKLSINFKKNNIDFKGGMEGAFHRVNPGDSQINSATFTESANLSVVSENGFEGGAFIQSEFEVGKLQVLFGARFSTFFRFGEGVQYLFDSGRPRSVTSIIDSVAYESNTLQNIANGIEPRVSLNYLFDSGLSIKAAYNRNYQYLHLLTNSYASLPTDYWKLTDLNFDPKISDQFSVGVFKNFLDNIFETSLEFYYKYIDGVQDLKNGTQLLRNENIIFDLLQGEGRSAGAEIYIKKKKGNLTGFLSYTYSRSEQRFKSNIAEEEFNDGEWYRANFDQPHNLNLNLSFVASRQWTIGGNFTFVSGRPITIPERSFLIGGMRVYELEDRNNFLIPNYHRLDLSTTYKGKNKRNPKVKKSFTFSIYNVYGRENPFAVFLKTESGIRPKAYQLSVLGSAFPSFTLNFEI